MRKAVRNPEVMEVGKVEKSNWVDTLCFNLVNFYRSVNPVGPFLWVEGFSFLPGVKFHSFLLEVDNPTLKTVAFEMKG